MSASKIQPKEPSLSRNERLLLSLMTVCGVLSYFARNVKVNSISENIVFLSGIIGFFIVLQLFRNQSSTKRS